MNSLTRWLGTLMVAAGALLLAYVGYAYVHRPAPVAIHRWSAAEQIQGRHLVTSLGARQSVRVPRAVGRLSAAAGTEPALRILIPKIRVDAPVVQTPPIQGVWEVADWSVGHLTTTPNPGGIGNGAYSAHDDIKGELFKRVGELTPGDIIRLRTRHFVYTYAVTRQAIVDPSNIHPLDQTTSATVTLISCAPYWVDTQRLIVQGVLKSTAHV